MSGEGLRIGAPIGRVVVVQAEGPEGLRDLRAAVGVTRFETADGPRVAIVVKLALHAIEQGAALPVARIAPEPARLSLDRAGRFPTDAGGLDYASDFAPRKAGGDVLVVGHAYAPAPTTAIDARLEMGPVRVAFGVRSGSDARAIPLAPPYLQIDPAVVHLAPHADAARARGGDCADVDWGIFNASAISMRAPRGAIRCDAALGLPGVLPGNATSIRLPGLHPVVSVETAEEDDARVDVVLDTVWLDTDEGALALVWRGDVAGTEDDLERVVVSLERLGAERDAETRLADLQRGSVAFAVTEDDVALGADPPDDDPRLTMARHATLASVAPEPRLPLPVYARISAELLEEPAERGRVLARHDLDEHRWLVEERAWLERFAASAADGDTSLATRSGELFLQAQDALADRAELARTLADYARLRVATERALDPLAVLSAVPMTLGAWMRLERRWLARAEDDPAVASELDRLLRELAATEPDPLADDAQEEEA